MYHRIMRLFSIYAAYHLPEGSRHPRLDRLRLVPRFLRAGVRALPAALRWARLRDPAARARVKQLLDLSGPAPVPLVPALFRTAGPVSTAGPLTIVLPVYGGGAMLAETLRRVAVHTDAPWRMVLVDDASPDPETLPLLRAWARDQGDRVTLLVNEANLGFVGTVNRALTAAQAWPDDPVVLLNSDAWLPAGWAGRLLRPLADPHVASVTPLSNDAELGSVPEPGRAGAITAAQAQAIDYRARDLNGAAPVAAPAGVGFCMALSPAALKAEPQFDMAFAPGYGEEVDWCRKLAAKGFVHVYTPDLYVAHVGGQSFGSDQKRALIARNSEILTRRYPSFDAEVHGFLRRDPLVTARLALGLARAEALRPRDTPLLVYLGHSMGGGAETDLMRRVRADLGRAGAALVIRVGGVFRFTAELWQARADGTPGMVAGGTADRMILGEVLRPVTRRALVYSCGVGDPDPVALPGLIQSLFRRETDSLTVLVHDYFPLSPTPSLLEEGERWQGLPDPARASPRHVTRRPDGTAVPLATWRAEWGGLLHAADRVECFSEAARRLVEEAYPGLRPEVRPHALPTAVPRLDPPPPGRPVIGILGNLAPHKGAPVAEALSRHIGRDSAAGLVLLGDIDPAHRLHPPAVLHGAYTVSDLPELARKYRVSCWLIPSLWPETFSFTTHEALATGLPVMVFDLGAQGDAVTAALAQGARGAVLPLSAAGDPARLVSEAARLSKT